MKTEPEHVRELVLWLKARTTDDALVDFFDDRTFRDFREIVRNYAKGEVVLLVRREFPDRTEIKLSWRKAK
jgi:hypothetical protein